MLHIAVQIDAEVEKSAAGGKWRAFFRVHSFNNRGCHERIDRGQRQDENQNFV